LELWRFHLESFALIVLRESVAALIDAEGQR
jgi:hypothetical protein